MGKSVELIDETGDNIELRVCTGTDKEGLLKPAIKLKENGTIKIDGQQFDNHSRYTSREIDVKAYRNGEIGWIFSAYDFIIYKSFTFKKREDGQLFVEGALYQDTTSGLMSFKMLIQKAVASVKKTKNEDVKKVLSVVSKPADHPNQVLEECIDIVNSMEDLSNEEYSKIVKKLIDVPDCRIALGKMPEHRRHDFIKHL